jgi:PAS domain S-box-containing protein
MASVKDQPLEALNDLNVLRDAVIARDIVAITDPFGKITYVNDKFCAVSKYSREELLGQDLRIVNSGHHPKEFIRDLWKTIAAGKSWRGEFRNLAKDGTNFWVDTTITPQLNKDGKPLQYFSIGIDVTEYVALRRISAAFETVMKTATERIFFKDRNSRFVRASQAHVTHLGASHLRELRGKTDLDFFSEEHALAAAQDEQAIVRSGESIINKEEKETYPNGTVTWALSSKMPWRDKEGNIIGIMGVSRDVTELKQAKHEAAQWQERFKFVLESLPLGISWDLVGEDGRTTQRLINEEHLRICGITREQANQWDLFRRITHPDDQERQAALRFQVAMGKIDRYALEKRYLRSDGQAIWVLFSYRTRNPGNGYIEDLCSALNITDRKMMEEKLRISEVLLTMTGQLAKVGIWIVELPSRVMHWNEQLYQIRGASFDYEPSVEATVELHTPECRETFREAFEACAREGTPFDLELEMITSAGSRVWVRTMGQADVWDGQPQRVFGAMQDITAVKKGVG